MVEASPASPSLTPARRRGMLASVAEGSIYNIWFYAVSGSFLTGFALYLGASGTTIGILGSLLSFGTLLQLFVAPLLAGIERRRNFIAILAGVQRIGLALAGLLAIRLLPSPTALLLFVLLNVVAWTLQAPMSIMWQGYMTDLVPLEIRGRYFATRSAWSQGLAMLTMLAYGGLVARWPGTQGFRYLYWGALLGAVLDTIGLMLHPNLPRGDRPTVQSFWASVRTPLSRPGPHRVLALFLAAWGFVQNLAAPFYPLLMVKRLGIPLGGLGVLTTIAALAAILTSTYWGRLQDRMGETKTIGILTGGLATVPLLLLAARYGGWPVLILAHIVSGSCANGLGLAQQTLSMRLVHAENRGAYFAFFASAGGLTGFVAPLLAGPLTTQWIVPLFVLSAVGSGAIALLWHRKLGPAVG